MSPSRSCASCRKGRSADVASRALPLRRPVAPCISTTKLCRKSHKLLDRRQPSVPKWAPLPAGRACSSSTGSPAPSEPRVRSRRVVMDAHAPSQRNPSRGDLQRWSGVARAAGAPAPAVLWSPAHAKGPKRGGPLPLRLWDPPHFDPHLTISYKTHIIYSFTHSRLLKNKAGPSVTPGTFPIEGDLAESWTQPNETTYIFKLRRGVRWQNRPPVNGRELTAEAVTHSVQRF